MTWFEVACLVGSVVAFFSGGLAVVLWWIIQTTVRDLRALKESHELHKLEVKDRFAEKASTVDVDRSFNKLQECIDNINRNIADLAVSNQRSLGGIQVILATLTEKLNHKE